MSAIRRCMQSLAQQNRKAVIPYVVAGDPAPEYTLGLMQALVDNGADIIELGVPFSDPMAEGPVIQLGHERALEHKVGLRDVLKLVETFRQSNTQTPVVLMGYANPIIAMGYEKFAIAASKAGVDGVLTVDLPPEECADLNNVLKAQGIDTIFLVAPTTSEARTQSIVENASGYIYYVSLKGVTGAGHLDTAEVEQKVKGIKQKTDLPVCVGFGIKDAESAKLISAHADGVVVGSLLVNGIAQACANVSPDKVPSIIENCIQTLLPPIAAGANS